MSADGKNSILTENEYVKTYKTISKKNARKAIIDFDKIEKWNSDNFGNALVIFAAATCKINDLTEDDVNRLSSLINEYDKFQNVKSECEIKRDLFFYLGCCWHELGESYDNRAIEAFKKYLYYIISPSSYANLLPEAYAFRKCNKFLYQSLINDQLNISSPTTFNDPFDCPIRVLLKLLNKGDEISKLVRYAYQDCLKIACFTSNIAYDDVFKHKKHRNDKDEFSNELMWAHYADSHKGICIKYHFSIYISKLMNEDKNVVSYFKDVKYSSKKLSSYSKKGSISVEDAFFLKGKKWEYENELRFLHFDLNGKGEHGIIKIPNCIEAIYFGLECSEKDKETIINIMKSKPVEFYQMEFDKQHFGRLKAVKIENQTD